MASRGFGLCGEIAKPTARSAVGLEWKKFGARLVAAVFLAFAFAHLVGIPTAFAAVVGRAVGGAGAGVGATVGGPRGVASGIAKGALDLDGFFGGDVAIVVEVPFLEFVEGLAGFAPFVEG